MILSTNKFFYLLCSSCPCAFETMQDWLDVDFGIAEGVDFIAVSFVKSAEVINHLKSYIAARCWDRYIENLVEPSFWERMEQLPIS